MEAKYPEITLGEPVCAKLKDIYFSAKEWHACYRDVAAKFNEFKNIARKFYSGKSDKEMLTELVKYTKEDIIDAFGV
jgi:hypothetical protein